MAVTRTPTSYFTGFELLAANGQASAKSIAIPVASLDGLTDAEANASTGDAFEILRAILETFRAKYAALDQSTRLSVSKSPFVDSADHIIQTYTVVFDTTAGTVNVAPEPAA